MTPAERLKALNELVTTFDTHVSQVEADLMDKLAIAAASLLKNPANLSFVLNAWQPQWAELIQQLTTGILSVSDLNTAYFTALSISPGILDAGTSDLLTAIGITSAGLLVEGGYLATIYKDTSIGRQLISAITDAKLSALGESGVIAKLKSVVTSKQGKGVVGRLLESLDTQPHIEADRVLQRSIAVRANLRASLYLGGLIDSSRPFCQARNGKVFLVEEIARFGTSRDTYGGYSDKSSGAFNGKPKSGYDPFTQCGGVRCRHGWNYISNAEAIRRRDDIEEVNGVLRVKKAERIQPIPLN